MNYEVNLMKVKNYEDIGCYLALIIKDSCKMHNK